MRISRLVSFRHAAVLAAATLFSAAVPHVSYAPDQWALIIGISDYQNFGDEMGGDLPGAVNDANAFRDVAIARLGVPESNVHLVLDAAATRERIESEFTQWLPSVVGPDDIVWVFFAGHGSQVWDEDGDEEDGLEETICPTDVARGSPDMDIVDDDVAIWLQGIPAAEVVVFWDKCHAESSTRAVTPFARPRALDREPEEDLDRPARTGLREARVQSGLGDRIARRPLEEWRGRKAPNIVEVAASQADQVAVDAAFETPEGETRFGGAFTTNFVKNAWQAPSDATIEDLFERTRNDLRSQRFQQQPQLSGESALRTRSLSAIANGAAADVEGAPSRSGSVPVLAVNGNLVTLAGGASTGATAGSVYAVGRTLLRVEHVADDEIHATLSSTELRGISAAQADTLAPGARAHLVAHAYAPAELSVSLADVPAATRAPFEAALAGVPALRIVTEAGRFADLLVRPSENGFIVLGLDGFARHRIPAADAAAAARQLRAILEREVEANELAELDNPAAPFELEFAFNHEDSRFGLGDLVEFHVTSERAGYLTIVDLGTDGSVTVLFPNDLDADNRIDADESFVLPTPTMNMVFRATPPAGRGIVRAFLTERPLEIALDGNADLGRAVLDALARAVGESPIPDAMPVTSWATRSIAYEVTQ
ncbi:MAG TPA: caspase family protein [Longimicrobiales bacterium]